MDSLVIMYGQYTLYYYKICYNWCVIVNYDEAIKKIFSKNKINSVLNCISLYDLLFCLKYGVLYLTTVLKE